jgi:hypothetical protein
MRMHLHLISLRAAKTRFKTRSRVNLWG